MKQTLHEVVGERIRTLRRRRHWTQPQLACQSSIGMTTLNRLENGHHSMSIDKLVALVQTLETSADYLLGLTEEPSEARGKRKTRVHHPPVPRPSLPGAYFA